LTLFNFLWSQRHGESAPPDHWRADTLEWATTSPPPEYNFAKIPVVTSRDPLWDEEPLRVAEPGPEPLTALTATGALEKTMPVTEGLDAKPQAVLGIPEPSYLPFIAALGVGGLFVGLLVKAALIGVVGVGIGALAVVWWLWRTDEDLR
jgi:hypothetical protein